MTGKKTFNGKKISFTVFLALISSIFMGTASAATLTVDDSGGADYMSIQDAINAAAAGDTILVYSGTYYENVYSDKHLSLIGIDNGNGIPVVDAGGTGYAISILNYWGGSSTLSGFKAINGSIGGISSETTYEYGGSTLINNIASGNGGIGIYLSGCCSNTLINNTVSDNSGNGIHMYCGAQLQNNMVSNNSGHGIYAYCAGFTFINNTVSNNSGIGIFLDQTPFANLQNNIVSNNGGDGMNLYGGNTITNNIVSNNSGIGISLSGAGSVLQNNMVSNNSNGGIYNYYSSVINNTISGNGNYGIYIWHKTSGRSYPTRPIYNNYFNNSNNVGFNVICCYNIWNTTKTSGTNIVGGPYIGGNFWANPNGTGYSQTCTDADRDEICDSPYILDSSDTDYLPLSMNFALEGIAPTTTITLSGTSGNNGWFTSDVQATLNAIDNEGGSGVKITEYSFDGTNWIQYNLPFSITNEGMRMVYFKSTDNADNVESIKNQTVKIDKTPPTITSAPTTSPNANGWHNSGVVVHFTASDTISGIDTVTPDTTISTEGTDQSVTGTAVDKAGNSASATVSGINIDKTQPQVTINTPLNSAVYILNQALTADWSATDSLSGIASATGTLSSGIAIDTSTVGSKTFTVTATDNASNTATQTAFYAIGYNFLGILPPIKTDSPSIFKLGSTVPVKFRIADANGNYVSTAVANLTYQKITDDILGTIEEPVSTSAANEGNTFRYDSTDNLYIFNLGTNGMVAGTYQLNINLDDGTVHAVNISLR